MKEEIDKLASTSTTEINETIIAVSNFIESGTQFISEQTPLLIQEILAYQTAYHVFMVLLFVIYLGAYPVIFKYSRKEYNCISNFNQFERDTPEYKKRIKQYNNDLEHTHIAIMVASSALSITSIGFMIYHTLNLVKITLAPRLYLIEYLANLIN